MFVKIGRLEIASVIYLFIFVALRQCGPQPHSQKAQTIFFFFGDKSADGAWRLHTAERKKASQTYP